jgi:hypothetical protein
LGEAGEDRRRADEERRRSDVRFERMFEKVVEDSVRREGRMIAVWGEVRQVGRAILKTLKGHTKLLEGIHKYAGRNGRPGNGASRR